MRALRCSWLLGVMLACQSTTTSATSEPDAAADATGAEDTVASDGSDGSDGVDSTGGDAGDSDGTEGSDGPTDATDATDAPDGSDGLDATDSTGVDGTTGFDGSDGSDGADDQSDCPADLFLNVSAAPGPGGTYGKPSLSVVCTATTMIVESNGLPHYTFVPITPNPLVATPHHWEVARSPVVATDASPLPLLGAIGFSVNGQPIFGPNEGPVPEAEAFGDPIFNGIMDECMGHTSDTYHYHALVQKCLVPASLVAKPWENADVSPNIASPVLGFALDGFAIYGRYGCLDLACESVVEFKSGWKKIGDPTSNAWDAYEYEASEDATVLDKCNGRLGPDGIYRYYETANFPYILGCYSGNPDGAGLDPIDGTDAADGSDGVADGTDGVDGGDPPGPKKCVTDADCAAKGCPPNSKGCACLAIANSSVCVPTCTTDADCPKGPGGAVLLCGDGKCKPKDPPAIPQ